MGFKDILGASQTVFSNADALDLDFVPKLLPHRENQQHYIASCVKPLFFGANGRHLIVTGPPGIGKTACVRRVLLDLEEETDDVNCVYVNCWSTNTTYKVLTAVAHALGYKFTHNMSTDEILDKVRELSSKLKGLVFVFDEADKAEDFDFIYLLLELASKKTVILVSAEADFGAELDLRVMSRLVPERLELKPYTAAELRDILAERAKYGFFQGVLGSEAFELLWRRASEFEDVRVGIALLKAAGLAAEADASKRIEPKHAELAVKQLAEIRLKTSSELSEEEKQVLILCKESDGQNFGAIYNLYVAKGGAKSERTFKRVLDRLEHRKLIVQELASLGQGRTSIIWFKGLDKRLDDF